MLYWLGDFRHEDHISQLFDKLAVSSSSIMISSTHEDGSIHSHRDVHFIRPLDVSRDVAIQVSATSSLDSPSYS